MNLELDDTATGTVTASAAGETPLTGDNSLRRGESVGAACCARPRRSRAHRRARELAEVEAWLAAHSKQ